MLQYLYMCMHDAGVSSSLSAEPSWRASPRGAWHTAWLCQCGRGCVGVVAPLCRISTPVPPTFPLNTHTLAITLTLFSCSIHDTTYCLPPTGVNLSIVTRCQKKQSLPSHSCLLVLCDSLCGLEKEKLFKLTRSVKYEYSVRFCAYVAAVFCVCVCACVCWLLLHVLRRFSRAGMWLPKVDWLGSWHLTSLFSQLNHDNHSWHLLSFIFCFDT